jgi:hypothetical protein
MSLHRSILIADYMTQVAPTDQLPPELNPILLGIFGEVGSIMATAKKYHREKEAYTGYRRAVEEEFGDALWYFTALCRRLNVAMDEILDIASSGTGYASSIAANDLVGSPISRVATPLAAPELDSALLQLGEVAAALLALQDSQLDARDRLIAFADRFLRALKAARVTFAEVVRLNLVKTVGRFLPPDYPNLPDFDCTYIPEEQLPRQFEITIDQRSTGHSYMRMNGVFIGDPLTDNILDLDGYRFHDVFHFSHAAILHWSPTFRALIKHKRRSNRKVDEAEDGGRAIVVEEGLSAWIFARSKELNYFEGQKRLSFELLKTIQQFVSGYEVEACPLSLWERAILQGYQVFRQVRANLGGTIVCDRTRRTIEYRMLGGNKT